MAMSATLIAVDVLGASNNDTGAQSCQHFSQKLMNVNLSVKQH